jgi:hypothetical protein
MGDGRVGISSTLAMCVWRAIPLIGGLRIMWICGRYATPSGEKGVQLFAIRRTLSSISLWWAMTTCRSKNERIYNYPAITYTRSWFTSSIHLTAGLASLLPIIVVFHSGYTTCWPSLPLRSRRRRLRLPSSTFTASHLRILCANALSLPSHIVLFLRPRPPNITHTRTR